MADMRTMTLDQSHMDALTELRKLAERVPIRAAELVRMCSGKAKPVGDDPRRVVMIPDGIRVVLSIEEQAKGYYRHASFSVTPPTPGVLPNVSFVWVLLPALGFEGKPPTWNGAQVWIEKEVAVNVLQRVGPGVRIG